MRRLHVLLWLVPALAFGAEIPVSVPSDPKAKYFVLERGGTKDKPTMLTKRVGPSGTSFAKREFDCHNQTFRYLAEGDTIESMPRSKPDDKLTPITDQSISYYMWIEACKKQPKGVV